MGSLVALIQSKAFGLLCYLLAAVCAGYFIYLKTVQPSRRYGELNISCFVYRDLNRNGRYDLGERALAGVEAGLHRPRGSDVITRSNIGGFANFVMSAGDRAAAVNRAGPHTVTVSPPSGWRVTSGNATQTAVFRLLSDAPVGVVTDRVFAPVGLAPELTMAGRWTAGGGGAAVKVVARPSGASVSAGAGSEIPLPADGGFGFSVAAGPWTTEWQTAEGAVVGRRTVEVADWPIWLGGLASGEAPRAIDGPVRSVGFDTLTISDTVCEVPNGYGDLNWFGWVAMHQKFPNGAGFINATCSSEYVAYSSSGHPAEVSSDRPFDFVGAKLTMGWPAGEAYDVILRAWRGEQLAYEDRVRLSTAGPLYFSADYRGITRLQIGSSAYWQVAVEDFEYRLR